MLCGGCGRNSAADGLANVVSDARYRDSLTPLGKGGFVVRTALGNIQFGLPPETVKDSMALGAAVPEYYIIPRVKFDWNDGISLMEFEFPVYYNYFLRKRTKTKFICDAESARQVREIFQETLLGPADLNSFAADFVEDYAAMPLMERELAYFARAPHDPAAVLRLEDFFEFMLFDAEGRVAVRGCDAAGQPAEVRVEQRGSTFLIFEGEAFVCEFDDALSANKQAYFAFASLVGAPQADFDPPQFGVTVLGGSHGFDCAASTSGFILWLSGKGVMVDPPPYSAQALREMGVPAHLIEKVIVTHCHADHDAGAFHKLLDAAPVDFISTPTIMDSFLRKYAAVSQVPVAELRRLFNCRSVKVGHPTMINGARFLFEYSFHSIPALCFSVELGGKRFFFSGDTFYSPERLAALRDEGVLSPARHAALAQRDFGAYDLIFHEAGIPPIHTPAAVFAEWPEALRARLLLYHIAEKDVPAGRGLRAVRPGLAETIVLLPPAPPTCSLADLELFCSLEIARNIPLYRVLDAVRCLAERRFAAGETILAAGSRGTGFYILKRGVCEVSSAEPGARFRKLYHSGDYFGESAVTGDGRRLADVTAVSAVVVLEAHRDDVAWLFALKPSPLSATPSPLEMMRNLSAMRQSKLAEFINANGVIAKMTEREKSLLNMYLKEAEAAAGEELWGRGAPARFCFFIKSGKYQMKLPLAKVTRDFRLVPGTLVGDFPSLCDAAQPAQSAVQCLQPGKILKISREDFANFVLEYPSFYIFCKDRYAVF